MKAICLFKEGFRLYADSAAHRNCQPIFLPDFDGGWIARICPAVRISRLGMHISRKFASRYYDAVSVAAMIVPRPMASDPFAMPERFFAMDSAYAVGCWQPLPPTESAICLSCDDRLLDFSIDGLDVDSHVHCLSEFMTFKTGDILLFADPSCEIGISEGDRLSVLYGQEKILDLKIR